jgi:ATP synthase protein I
MRSRQADNGGKGKGTFKEVLAASQVGLNMVASTFAGLAIGYGLDKLFRTYPWLTLIFLFLGIIAGFVQLFRVAMKEAGNNGKKDL